MSQVGWPLGTYPDGGLERLGPHVTAYYADAFPVSNSAIVRGADATLVFDANVLRFARTLRRAVDAEPGPPLRHLVLSHVHDDHTLGAMHFSPPARAIARAYTRERLEVWATHDPERLAREVADSYPGTEDEGLAVRIVVPDVVVEEPDTLDLGGVVVHLWPEPVAHTKGDLWGLVEPDGVALCGDLWFNGCEPYFASGSIEGALAAVQHLREARASVYLPGHGRAGHLAPAGEDPVERYGAWLVEEIASAVGGRLAGERLAVAVRASYEERLDLRFPYSVAGFLEDAVAAREREVHGG